ncbi:hypothetical protein ABI59_03935 [Acidobacteria bacterium Mor1]|nr:hypothetical protein ABI59_03935 [Acidobacteria bacterium Mor1]
MGQKVAVVGGGAWGTALAVQAARAGFGVHLWMREPELVQRMLERRDNPVYLPGNEIPPEVTPSGDLAQCLEDAALAISAIPAQFARRTLEQAAPALASGVPVAVAAKGIEEGSGALPLTVAREALGEQHPLAVISGPTFAAEVVAGHPTALVVASTDEPLATQIQGMLSSDTFRLYTNDDPTGVQVAASLKNVMAIAAGVIDGLGMGHNSLAALITRGLVEMGRLGEALGGKAATFSGLAGLGDLVLTCTGELSRNRKLGQRLAGGERLQDIVAASRSVAEGVATTQSARALAHRSGVDMPIVEEVYRLLYEDGSPREAIHRLMTRPLRREEGERS